jgi:hypothetical protein
MGSAMPWLSPFFRDVVARGSTSRLKIPATGREQNVILNQRAIENIRLPSPLSRFTGKHARA